MVLPVSQPTDLTGTVGFYFVAWFDIAGDPLRATTLPAAYGEVGYTFAGTGDADLDGHAFLFLPTELVNIGPATHSAAGSDTVAATLAGIGGPNDDLLTALATQANWKGRTARLWRGKMSAAGVPLTLDPYYTGYIATAKLAGSPAGGSTVTMTVENYLALITAARGRTYQDQAQFDPADQSPARIRASAVGVSGAGILPAALGGGRGTTLEDRLSVRDQ